MNTASHVQEYVMLAHHNSNWIALQSLFQAEQAAAWAAAYPGGSGVGLGFPGDTTLGAECSIA